MKKQKLLALALCLSAVQAYSTEFFVTNNSDSGAGSLRQAIIDANADIVNRPHTITPDAPYEITLGSALPACQNVTINCTANKVITINAGVSTSTYFPIGGGSTTLNHMVFDYAVVAPSNCPSLTVNHCTFKNMVGNSAFKNFGSTVTFNNCTFTNNINNSTTSGGSAFTGNSGAISIFNDCVIALNSGTQGAAIVSANSLTMNRCIIANNTGTNTAVNTRGGGIASSGTICVLTDCWIMYNSAPRGAGITIAYGTASAKPTLTMTGCTIEGNTASEGGGGLYIQGGTADLTGTINITNSTFSGNTAVGSGGAINIGQGAGTGWIGDVNINNCTITGNTANGGTTEKAGGGIARGGGIVTCNINYSIVAGNNYNNGASFNNGRDLEPYSTTLWAKSQTGRNVYYGKVAWQATVEEGNVVLADEAEISTVLNTTLSDNGGPQLPNLPGSNDIQHIKTHALVANSPAINPTAASTGVQTIDQRRYLRDNTPDIGAFEYEGTVGFSSTAKTENQLFKREGNEVIFSTSGTVSFVSLDGTTISSQSVQADDRIDLHRGKCYMLLFSSTDGFASEKILLSE